MKFLNVKYHNYRCFKDIELNFNTTSAKNIALIVAPNGGGKTEMLFSFWWVLYNFDFSSLKGKENTAYSLNSTLYHRLTISEEDRSEECWVEICFEHEDIPYTLRRSELFTKSRQGISSTQKVSLSFVDSNGESSVPIEDKDLVDRRLSQIIPKKILSGIIFDGERMKQLSSEDDNSRNAVEGVIRHITNEELFELCRGQFANIIEDIANELRRLRRKNGGVDVDLDTITNLTNQIEISEKAKKADEIKLESKKRTLKDTEKELRDISLELSRNQDSKYYEGLRTEYSNEKRKRRSQLEADIDTFYKDLLYGYLLISDKLIEDVTKYLDEDKDSDRTPLGLTVDAVDSILQMPECICGHPITSAERERLLALRAKLPPININSTVRQMIKTANDSKESAAKLLERSFNKVSDEERDINELTTKIAEVSEQITAGAPGTIQDLERRRDEAVVLKKKLEEGISKHEESIAGYNKRIADLVEDREVKTRARGVSEKLTNKDAFIRRCMAALTEIDEYNKKVSLQRINNRIEECYRTLSQDYIDGKRLYIIQFDKDKKYRMVTYSQKSYEDRYKTYKDDGTYDAWEAAGKDDEQIKESIIMKIIGSNSTGQGKINTLAFAKAILDYSRERRDEDSTEVSRSYPFLIDSPFTELSDGNLKMSSTNIHTFADQIILMISNESLAGVQETLEPYVSVKYEIIGNAGENNSTLKPNE